MKSKLCTRLAVVLMTALTVFSLLPAMALAADQAFIKSVIQLKKGGGILDTQGKECYPASGNVMISFLVGTNELDYSSTIDLTLKKKGGGASYAMPSSSFFKGSGYLMFSGSLPGSLPEGDYYVEGTYSYIYEYFEIRVNGVVTRRTPKYTTETVKSTDYVTIKKGKAPADGVVSAVTLSKTTLALAKGKSATLKATVAPSDAKNKAVTWTTSNKKVATVSSSGKIVAKANGTATITVKAKDGGKTATCKVTVGVLATKVTLNKRSATLAVGKTLTLKATLAPKKVTPKTVSWKSNNTKVATVKAGAVKGIKAGAATITATSWNGKTATCKVSVK